MDRITTREEQLRRRQLEAIERFPSSWSQMIEAWRQPGAEDRAWLMYAANYLFRTNNVRWVMDPLRLTHRLPQAPQADFAGDLERLSFVVLTHQHSDHLDLDLIRDLSRLPLVWVVPGFVLQWIRLKTDITLRQVIVPSPLHSFEIQGIRITPFDGLHWEQEVDGGLRGLPAMGYLIEFNGKRWLFPGDTRTYDASRLPSFGSLDGLFAHLWLGRGCAYQDEPPLTDAFSQFCLDLRPRRIVLTHLNEFGRDANDYWDESHAQLVVSKIRGMSPDIPVEPARMGASVLL